MQIRLTPTQQKAILHELEAGKRRPIAPFPCSLLEQGIDAIFNAIEAAIRPVVCRFIRPWKKRKQT